MEMQYRVTSKDIKKSKHMQTLSRLGWQEEKKINKIVHEYLQNKVIRKSENPKRSSIVPIKKSDGINLMCIYYR